jgi:alpha,alpha-trehalose-phosphate synthase [UDP-forming]
MYYGSMRQILGITAAVVAAVSLIIAGFTFNQANQEELTLSADLQYRTRILADSLSTSVTPALTANSTSTAQAIIDKISNNQQMAGIGVFNISGEGVAVSQAFPIDTINNGLIRSAIDKHAAEGSFMESSEGYVYVYVTPLNGNGRVTGALVLVQSANYIKEAVVHIWTDNALRLVAQLLLFGLAIFALVRWVFLKPLQNIAESIRLARRGEHVPEDHSHSGIFSPLTAEITKMNTSLRQARAVASEEARMRLEQLDSPWTAERLKEFIKGSLRNRPIFVVSNREPYVHERKGNSEVHYHVPAGGAVTALESVMEACEGMWIAYGSGSADKETADADGKIRVPPDEPHYTLKRIWLTDEDVQGYYNGFSNEALWPLCHMAHVRPLFRKEDWTAYRRVNGAFAKSILAEIRGVERPLILVQDYHLALLPELIKASRPDAQVAIFWHIPWPSPEAFSICPWRKEILQGILGADLIGFHTQQFCNNFLETVGSELESLIDFERFTISLAGHKSAVKPFPISIAYPGPAEPKKAADKNVLINLGINVPHLVLGVDRLDYTKGLLERFKGIDFFFDAHPQFKEKMTFLQIASPTRESVEKYREYSIAVSAEAERINQKFGTRTWKPIVLEKKTYTHRELLELYELAQVCMVTSLHDGMNLVAKEYVAARTKEDGALILSMFTGASRDLNGALFLNPYSAEETAEALHAALTMTKTEQHRRMKTMRDSVRDYNVYRWSAELIKALASLT